MIAYGRDRRSGKRQKLRVDMMRDFLCQRLRSSQQNGAGVDVVLGLGQHVGREETRIAIRRR